MPSITDRSAANMDPAVPPARLASEVAYRRTVTVVASSQLFGGVGVAAGIVTATLLGQDILASATLAGLPVAVLTLGAACAAGLGGSLSQRRGRRVGLVSGYLLGCVGAVGVASASAIDSGPMFLLSLFLYGGGTASVLQARYAAADLAPRDRRATSMSIIMVAATLGAALAPVLAQPMAHVAESLSVPALGGMFLLAAVAYALAALVLHLLLRPDPLELSGLHEEPPTAAPPDAVLVVRPDGLSGAAVVMVLVQLVMVALMTMTPAHMYQQGHGLGPIGVVMSAHLAAIYLPSLITGVLVDRVGRHAMTLVAGAAMLLAGIAAAVAPVDSFLILIAAMVMLGLGWNIGMISASAMVVDSTAGSSRAGIQGRIDLLTAAAGSIGGAGAGLIVAFSSYAALSTIVAVASLPVVIVAWSARRRASQVAASPI